MITASIDLSSSTRRKSLTCSTSLPCCLASCGFNFAATASSISHSVLITAPAVMERCATPRPWLFPPISASVIFSFAPRAAEFKLTNAPAARPDFRNSLRLLMAVIPNVAHRGRAVQYNSSMDRRTFLAGAAIAAASSDTIRGAIIGAGGRGRLLTAEFKEVGVQAANTGAKAYDNYRRLLEDKSIDVVVIATPDHWHAQMTIDAVQAGKDVYVEKPMAHTVEDGFRMIEATRRTKRVVQVGTQRRSYPVFQEAKQIMESGRVGQVRLVNSWWINKTPAALSRPQLKGKLDWKEWLGSAPARPLDPVRFRNWYWFWDYSGGLLVGQAAHVLDAINWFMGSTYPLSVTCTGRLAMEGAEVPETASMTLEYQDYIAVFSLGYKGMRYAQVNDQMKQFHGDKARFDVGRESYALYPEQPTALDLKPEAQKREPGSFNRAVRQHIRNFLECVRTRRDPNATVEMGQATNVALCMGMEALRTGRRVRFDAAARRMV